MLNFEINVDDAPANTANGQVIKIPVNHLPPIQLGHRNHGNDDLNDLLARHNPS
jgi:hypothetical protein